MLENIVTVALQVLALFIMMAAGFALFRLRVIDDTGVRQMTDVLLYAVTPCVVIDSLSIEFRADIARNIASMAIGAFALILIAVVCGTFIYRKQGENDRPVIRNALMLTNCGFLGIPVVQAVCGESAVLFASVYVCISTFFQWTFGYAILSGGKAPIKKVLLNPGTIGFALGMIIFCFSIELPSPVSGAVSMLADVNSPLAMLIIGACLAKNNPFAALRDSRVYIVSALRLIVSPLIAMSLLAALPYIGINIDNTVRLVLLIEFSAPIGAVVTMMSTKCSRNAEFSGRLVAFSTLCSIITMPVMIALGQQVLV